MLKLQPMAVCGPAGLYSAGDCGGGAGRLLSEKDDQKVAAERGVRQSAQFLQPHRQQFQPQLLRDGDELAATRYRYNRPVD